MKPSDTLVNELTELEKDLSRAKRNQGTIYSVHRIIELEQEIQQHKQSISLLAAKGF